MLLLPVPACGCPHSSPLPPLPSLPHPHLPQYARAHARGIPASSTSFFVLHSSWTFLRSAAIALIVSLVLRTYRARLHLSLTHSPHTRAAFTNTRTFSCLWIVYHTFRSSPSSMHFHFARCAFSSIYTYYHFSCLHTHAVLVILSLAPATSHCTACLQHLHVTYY